MTDKQYADLGGWDAPQGNAASSRDEVPKQTLIALPVTQARDILDYLYYLRATHGVRTQGHAWQDSLSQLNSYIIILEQALRKP